jgi:hypothetical protein
MSWPEYKLETMDFKLPENWKNFAEPYLEEYLPPEIPREDGIYNTSCPEGMGSMIIVEECGKKFWRLDELGLNEAKAALE